MQRLASISLLAVACGATGKHATGVPQASIVPSSRAEMSAPRQMAPRDTQRKVPTAAGDLTFEMGPDDVERACRGKGGRVHRLLTSNRIEIDCKVGDATFGEVWVSHCPVSRHVCFLTQSTAPMAADRAEQLRAKLAAQLTNLHGNAVEKEGSFWSWSWSDDGRIDLSTDADAAGIRVRLLHGTAEGIKSLLKAPPAFPLEVVGFPFGATEQEARERCERNGGKFASSAVLQGAGVRTIAPIFACDHPHAELPFEVKNLFALLCDERICELGLILGSSVDAALGPLSGKYGPPHSYTEPGKCKAVAARHIWHWGSGGVIVGSLKLADDCDVSLFYDNALGYQLRDQEYQRRRQNF